MKNERKWIRKENQLRDNEFGQKMKREWTMNGKRREKEFAINIKENKKYKNKIRMN